MKRFKNIFNLMLSAAIASMMLISCDDPTYPGLGQDGEGQLSTSGMDVSVNTKETVVKSARSGYDVSGFTVNVVNKESGNIKNTWKYSEMPGVVTLPVGNYSIEVYNAPVKIADWEAPYYYSSKDFKITKNEITEVGAMVCKLNNVKVSIKYSRELAALIGKGDDVKVNVVVGEEGMLDFVYSETRSGYFKYVPQSTTLVATFSGTVDGCFIEEYKALADVAPGQHRIITFGVKGTPETPDEYGQIGTSGLSMDSSVTSEDINVNVGAEEDAVDPDDMLQLSTASLNFNADAASKDVTVTTTSDWAAANPVTWVTLSAETGIKGTARITVSVEENTAETARDAEIVFTMGNLTQVLTVHQAAKGDMSMPTITSTTLNLDGVNKIVEGMTATVDIAAPKGITNLFVTIDSPTLTKDDLQGVGLDNNFDLANPGALDGALSGLGFPTGDKVLGKTSILFDITQFMSMLDMFKSEHRFILKVVDAQGQAVEQTITFLAQ